MTDIRAELERKTPGSREAHERTNRVVSQVVVGTVHVPHPIYIRESKGSKVTDVDGNEYIDLSMGFGPHILGHAPDVVVDAIKEAAGRGLQWGLHSPYQEPLASLMVDAIPGAEKVVFCNTGTEATMYAIRAARGYTGKDKIAVFDGGYHGAHDYVMVALDKNSPQEAPTFRPLGHGVPAKTQENTIMLPYRSELAFDIIRRNKDDLAVVLVEPVQSSNPHLDGDFLRKLRDVCRESGVLFLMDEVITGFRLAYGGAEEFFDIVPDLSTYGKIIGGGTAVASIAGPAEIMDQFSRQYEIYMHMDTGAVSTFGAGSFNGNPLNMAAGNACISYLRDHPEVYKYLAEQGNRLADEINRFCVAEEIPAQILGTLSMFHVRIQPRGPIRNAWDIDGSMKEASDSFYMHLLNHGVAMPGTHLAFISAAHTPEDIDHVIDAFKQSFTEVRQEGLL